MDNKSHCSLLAYINIWKELLLICLRDKAKIALFFKIIELLLWFKTPWGRPQGQPPGQDRGAKTRPQGQLEYANPRGSPGGDGQTWIDWCILAWYIGWVWYVNTLKFNFLRNRWDNLSSVGYPSYFYESWNFAFLRDYLYPVMWLLNVHFDHWGRGQIRP